MFVGHYSAAIAAKSTTPSVPLWTFVAAAQLVDIAWGAFMIAGIERASIDQSLPGMQLVLEHMPYTHSLPAALAWSALAAIACRYLLKLSLNAAILVGAVVLSHWFLDLLVHRPDLALWPTGPKVGFALWNHEVAEQAIEIGLIALAALFWGATRARLGRAQWPAAIFIALMLAIQISAMFLPVQVDPVMTGANSLAVYLLLIGVAWLVDRKQPQQI